MTDKITPKIDKTFSCEDCHYKCSKKSDWDRHLLTSKHQKTYKILINTDKCDAENATIINSFICNCGKEYKHRQSLFNHKKKCVNNKPNENIFENEDFENNITHITPELIIEIIKQNQEFKEIIIEQNKQNVELQKQMLEVCKNGTHNTTNNNNTHTNSHNKAFNLNFFLNETCKDALNIQDFVSSIKPSIDDLENTGRRGYIEGISNIILKGLNKLEQHFRPIHCSDQKREILYIKDDNQWIKETDDKPILKKAIKTIANENIKKIRDWRDSNPDCTDSDSKKNSLYLKIVSNSMNGSTEEESSKNISKIISNVVKETVIDK